ncbi:MAG TPA: T9SS type A sorting domain-containing protein [Chitinivibrionales bacterium]|nr:T9SS type A sorting domain-containing protein [Chitinivibrionales bacterium]
MTGSASPGKTIFLIIAGVALFAVVVNAEIPAGYKGKPYPPGSAPHEIPGRISFHDYDYVSPSQGSPNGVTFIQDDLAGSAAGSTAGGRDGSIPGIPKDSCNAWPAMWKTNHHTDDGIPDTFYAAGVAWPNGVRFPGPDTSVNDWYIGASHPDGMTKYTIHVPKAGKYWISSIWASASPPAQYHLSFYNGASTVSTPSVVCNGMTASYHAWYKFSDFASVQLDSGVQVMQFQNESMHLNQDFIYIAADSGDFTTGIEQPASKAPGAPQSNLSIDRGTIRFAVPSAGKTKISVYDCLGRELLTVLDMSVAAGRHSVALNQTGLKKGIYFLRMEQGNASSVTKLEQIR